NLGTSRGTIQIGDGGTGPSNVLVNSNVVLPSSSGATSKIAFNRSDNATYAGVISGSTGFVDKDGAGTLVLTGANTTNDPNYPGGHNTIPSATSMLTILNGSVEVGAGGTIGSYVGS